MKRLMIAMVLALATPMGALGNILPAGKDCNEFMVGVTNA